MKPGPIPAAGEAPQLEEEDREADAPVPLPRMNPRRVLADKRYVGDDWGQPAPPPLWNGLWTPGAIDGQMTFNQTRGD
jgi:hypothetical protein